MAAHNKYLRSPTLVLVLILLVVCIFVGIGSLISIGTIT
jgi:hypothetical protein